MMKIAIGNDHTGVNFKNLIVKHLNELGYEVINFGADNTDSCDYPDYALKVCECVLSGTAEKGFLICGTGIGMTIAANKVPGIRCALCHSEYEAEITRKHNNSNIMAVGERVLPPEKLIPMVDAFINTEFEGGRHERRVNKIIDIENKFSK